MNCTVCGKEVESLDHGPTRPSEWAFRYSARVLEHFEPGTRTPHRCRLTPRTFRLAAPEYEPPRVNEAPQPREQRPGTGGVVL